MEEGGQGCWRWDIVTVVGLFGLNGGRGMLGVEDFGFFFLNIFRYLASVLNIGHR